MLNFLPLILPSAWLRPVDEPELLCLVDGVEYCHSAVGRGGDDAWIVGGGDGTSSSGETAGEERVECLICIQCQLSRFGSVDSAYRVLVEILYEKFVHG